MPLLTIPICLAIGIGSTLLIRSWKRTRLLPEEVALAVAWVFVVGGLVWLEAYLKGSTLLGFGPPWTWLAAAHFGAAGYGALTVTALVCRTVSHLQAQCTLRVLLAVHPVAYLVTAAGISGVRYCSELGALSYFVLFVVQLGAFFFGNPSRISVGPRILLALALAVPLGTIVPALAWAWQQPLLDLGGMVKYHGVVNAIGHVGLGLLALGWGRPQSHAPFREPASNALQS
ncbi:MAG: YndJ family transporter [Bacteroidota bacterium]